MKAGEFFEVDWRDIRGNCGRVVTVCTGEAAIQGEELESLASPSPSITASSVLQCD